MYGNSWSGVSIPATISIDFSAWLQKSRFQVNVAIIDSKISASSVMRESRRIMNSISVEKIAL